MGKTLISNFIKLDYRLLADELYDAFGEATPIIDDIESFRSINIYGNTVDCEVSISFYVDKENSDTYSYLEYKIASSTKAGEVTIFDATNGEVIGIADSVEYVVELITDDAIELVVEQGIFG